MMLFTSLWCLVLFPSYKKGFKISRTGSESLRAGTPVGTSLIDAHAGAVGVMESVAMPDPEANSTHLSHKMINVQSMTRKLFAIAWFFSSTCHMAVSLSNCSFQVYGAHFGQVSF